MESESSISDELSQDGIDALLRTVNENPQEFVAHQQLI